MKKILASLLPLLFLPSMCWAVEATALTGTCYDVDPYNKVVKCYYESSTSVTSATDVVFGINVPSSVGEIVTAFFVSSSTDCDIHFSEKDEQGINSMYTVASAQEIDLWDLVNFDGAFYRNQDTTPVATLYMTVANDDAVNATGAWKAYITFKPQQ